jgi:hypothetical protein
MKVVLTGGTGFIGRHLVDALTARGDECVIVSRSGTDPWRRAAVRVVRGDPKEAGNWQRELDGADAVVNLAGELIVDPPKRWTAARKARLRASRIEATRRVVEAIGRAASPPRVVLSGSAVGYYGARGDDVVDESAPPGGDFLARLVVDWEAAAQPASVACRVVYLRTAPVLGLGGGALRPMLPIFKLGLGGPWGSGEQWWSWIHIADEVGLMLHLLDHDVHGPVNLTAPHPVTVNDFAKALGDVLHRPAILHVPAFAMRLALGEAATAMLDLQRVVPTRALESGYAFMFPRVGEALEEVVNG